MLPTSGPFGDKLLELSKTIFVISAFTKAMVKIKKIKCLFMAS